jgi:hypothetical protein
MLYIPHISGFGSTELRITSKAHKILLQKKAERELDQACYQL